MTIEISTNMKINNKQKRQLKEAKEPGTWEKSSSWQHCPLFQFSRRIWPINLQDENIWRITELVQVYLERLSNEAAGYGKAAWIARETAAKGDNWFILF